MQVTNSGLTSQLPSQARTDGRHCVANHRGFTEANWWTKGINVGAKSNLTHGSADDFLDYFEGWFMFSYDDRLRAVQLYIKLGKRVGLTIRQLGCPTKNALKAWHRRPDAAPASIASDASQSRLAMLPMVKAPRKFRDNSVRQFSKPLAPMPCPGILPGRANSQESNMPFPTSRFPRRLVLLALAATAATGLLAPAQAMGPEGRWMYEVTVTNITYNQRFTPLLLATHKPDLQLFKLGEPSSPQLAVLAEEGNVAPLRAVLDSNPHVTATAAGSALLDPGKSVTFQIQANPWRDRLSVAAMLIPTNDAFMALNAVPLPLPGHSTTLTAVAYDAGSEINDELCASIPGPFFTECGGPGGGARPGNGEGFVHVHRGMHGVADFKSIARDWRNPVATVRIRFMR